MSVVQNPLIGRARQKLGGTVFSTWKGINVIKGKPLTVANPKTDPQLMRRSALIQIVAIGRLIGGAINLGFREQAVQKSAFNAFTGYNLRNAFNYGTPPNAVIVPENIKVAQGTIAQTQILALVADASSTSVAVTFNDAVTGPGQSLADQARVVILNETTNEWFYGGDFELRSNGSITIFANPGSIATGNLIRAFLFFYNPATRKSSDSVNQTISAVA